MALAIALGLLAIASSSYAAGDRVASDAAVTEAENMIEKAGKSDPVDSKLIHAAMDKLHEAIRLYPRNDSAYVDLGFCYGVLRDGQTAVDMYHTATELNPSGSNFIELADIYLRVGDPEDALLAANAGIIKDPSNARLYNAKGMALNDLQRFGEAAGGVGEGAAAQPESESGAGKPGCIKRRPQRARQYQQALARGPSSCCRRSRKSRSRSYGASPTETSTRYGVVRS